MRTCYYSYYSTVLALGVQRGFCPRLRLGGDICLIAGCVLFCLDFLFFLSPCFGSHLFRRYLFAPLPAFLFIFLVCFSIFLLPIIWHAGLCTFHFRVHRFFRCMWSNPLTVFAMDISDSWIVITEFVSL